jgi:pimeloyl-ACP methyl ester carboxylesterase
MAPGPTDRAGQGDRAAGGDGVKVVAAPLPLTSFADDVAALDRTLERVDGPVVLVGHAYAGAVIAATRSEKVKALVYVAALAPDEGETVADVFYRAEPHPQAPEARADAHGLIWLPDAAFAAAFAQNASAEELAVLAAVQRPISPACITVQGGRPLWKDRPSWFLVAEQDRMIVQDTQRFMAERMKARCGRIRSITRRSSPRPDVVVDIIREAIARSRRLLTVDQVTNRKENAMTAINLSHRRRRRLQHLLSRGGAPGAPKLLLLHGFPSAGHMFRDLIPLLADRFHIVAPDLPGFGNPTCPRDKFAYTFDTSPDVIDRFTEVIGFDRFAVYVFDYGAPTGFRLAVKHPERITAIISQNGNAYEEA